MRDGTENDGIAENDYMPLSLTPNALHTGRDGKLFLAFGNVVHQWDASPDFLPYRWRSKLNAAPGHCNFAAARVTLEGYPWPARAAEGMRFQFLTDGRIALDRAVKHSNAFRLPSNRRNSDFEVELSGSDAVREVSFATSMAELANQTQSPTASVLKALSMQQ
jgi:hypothetical protein